MRARRFWAALGSLALVAGVAAPSGAATSPETLPVPTSMAALGDSITIAYDIKSLLRADPTYSWSTGTQPTVDSVYSRLEVANGAATLAKANYAVSGAKMADLATQAGKVAKGSRTGRELVTILMGANDACTKTEAAMTPVPVFRGQVDKALTTLAAKGIDQIVVASIPDVYKLWEVGQVSPTARFIWNLYGICQSMLANPSPGDSAAQARRIRVHERVAAFNIELANACAAISSSSKTTACKFDGNAAFNTSFDISDISTVDYFHPSVSGQAMLADVTYRAFGFPLP